MTGWGKAGVRLDARDGARRAKAIRSRRNREVKTTENELTRAHDKWRSGQVVPWRITNMLDLADLYGPKVDEACGVREPAVDRWEGGTLYPSWDQLQALAKLCGVHVKAFVSRADDGDLDVPVPYNAAQTSMRFHVKDPSVLDHDPVLRYTDDALTEAWVWGVEP